MERLTKEEYAIQIAAGRSVSVEEIPDDIYAEQQIDYHKKQVKYWKNVLKKL